MPEAAPPLPTAPADPATGEMGEVGREVGNFFNGVLSRSIFHLGDTPVSLTSLLTVAFILVVGYQVSRGLQGATEGVFKRRGIEDEGTLRMVQRLVNYAVLCLAFLVGLQTVGIDLSSLLAAGAVFAVGIGLAMQSIAENFVSGVILLVERTIRPGDIIEIDDRTVRVVEMSVRNTLVRTLDGEDIIVPNSNLAQGKVKNFTSRDRLLRVRVKVGVHYDSDLVAVRQVLCDAGSKMPWRVEDRPSEAFLRDFGTSSVDWELCVWCEDPWQVQRYQDQLRQAIWDGLKEGGIVISYPQLDLHLDPELLESLRERSPR